MDLLIAFITQESFVNGSPLSDERIEHNLKNLMKDSSLHSINGNYKNEMEFFFSAFNHLAVSAFSNLVQQNYQLERENKLLREQKQNAVSICKSLKDEMEDAKKKQQENTICKTCQLNQGELHQYEQKYQNLEKQLKKCALIINSSLDGGTKVLGRVKDILTQSIDDNNIDCEKNGRNLDSFDKNSEIPQKSLSKSHYFSSTKPILSPDDEDVATILAPSSPDACDVETQHFGGPAEVVCIPETVPFDYPPHGFNSQKFFSGQSRALSPVIRQKSTMKPPAKRSTTHLKKIASPIKPLKDDSLDSLNDSIYSPPLLVDFALPPVLTSKHKVVENNEGIRPALTTNNSYENVDPAKKNSKTGQYPFTEPQKHCQTPKSQKNKSLKQTKLTLKRLASEGNLVPPVTTAKAGTRISTKTVRVSPPAITTNKRMRRGKDPADWPCKECYRLFREAEATKKLDVRKMPVSMNFCPEHFNRYSYYLNTPPSFWNCSIGKAPRNGHLHPLDASAAKDDDDDDFVE